MVKFKKFIKLFLKHDSFIFQFYFYLKYLFASFKYSGLTDDFVFIAYTGTNGKSSCANLMYQSLLNLGEKVALVSTVNMAINDNIYPNKSKMTSLDINVFFDFLKDCKKHNVKYIILEYSSHAYVQQRLRGINFRQINLTSLMADHIEYHGSKIKYWEVKFSIIRDILKFSKASFFCNENCKGLLPGDIESSIYGKNTFESENVLKNVKFAVDSTSFELYDTQINSSLISELNLNNLLGIYSQLIDLGFSKIEVLRVLPKLKPVKGRFDFIRSKGLEVVLDYAHSEDSMENICKFFTNELEKKLILVFGATGGGRDVSKRPKMGRVADLYSDHIILTSDDPYMDDPKDIAEQIKEGVFNKDKVIIEIDRKKAIEKAFEISSSNSLILILGKAGEEVMAVDGKLIKYSDMDVVKSILNQIDEK